MLTSMTPKLKKQHKDMNAPSTLLHLCEMFASCARYEKSKVLKAFYRCKMVEGHNVGLYAVKIIGYIERLVSLGLVINND